MTKLSSHFSDVEWLEKVHNLLIEIARASLADQPRLPERVSTEALPLAQNAQILQQNAKTFTHHNLNWQHQSQWLEDVRQLLLELSRIALSDRPRLPENMAQRALMLAETAQDLREKLPDPNEIQWENEVESPSQDLPKNDLASTSTEQLLQQLQNHLQAEQANSQNSQLPQWQQVLTLLDVVRELYKNIHRSDL